MTIKQLQKTIQVMDKGVRDALASATKAAYRMNTAKSSAAAEKARTRIATCLGDVISKADKLESAQYDMGMVLINDLKRKEAEADALKVEKAAKKRAAQKAKKAAKGSKKTAKAKKDLKKATKDKAAAALPFPQNGTQAQVVDASKVPIKMAPAVAAKIKARAEAEKKPGKLSTKTVAAQAAKSDLEVLKKAEKAQQKSVKKPADSGAIPMAALSSTLAGNGVQPQA